MDTTTSKLILACYGLIALLVGIVGVLFYQAQPKSYRPASAFATPKSLVAAKPAAMSMALSKQLRLDIKEQRLRIANLQRLLTAREEVLRQQAAQLETQTVESRRLQGEADRYLGLLMELVQESADSMDDNLDALRDAEEGTRASKATSIDSLEAALEAAEWELNQSIETTTATELEMVAQAQKMEIMQQAILNAGDLSVPVLVNMMSEQDAEMRSWAATALGTIGSDSPIAMDALLLATEDDDASLRNAARAAIQQLNDN